MLQTKLLLSNIEEKQKTSKYTCSHPL